MTDWLSYGQFGLTMLAAQFSPGPDMLLLLKNAVNHPLRAGILTVLGIAAGLLVHTTVACLGLAAVFKSNPLAFRLFTWTGAAYLIYVALRILLSLRQQSQPGTITETAGEHPISDGEAFRQGLLTNLTNAKAFLFLASFLAASLSVDSSSTRKWVLGAIIIGQALVFWSLFVWLLRRRVIRAAYLRAERPLNLAFALLLILIAIRVAVS